ncbi:hypothetical protein [Actinosynnema sp. NPDC023587]|uniref:hypothetical protein n=1 Tax=Actinosynnema sp. NPDC023587 TaxID=3154695 RepID=UPI0033CA9D70
MASARREAEAAFGDGAVFCEPLLEEVRLCAEDPAHDWRPSTGTLHRFHVPDGVRTDSGVEDGSVVGVHYDPLSAKVIASAPTRKAVIRKPVTALDRSVPHGLVANRELLVRVLRHPAFAAGATHTGFLDRHGLTEPPVVDVRPAAPAAALELTAIRRTNPPLGWRNLPSQPQKTVFEFHGETVGVAYRHTRRGVVTDPGVHVVSTSRSAVVLERDGVRRTVRVAVHEVPRAGSPGDRGRDRSPGPGHRRPVLATTGGTVAEVLVAAGERVDVLAVVEPAAGPVGVEDRS